MRKVKKMACFLLVISLFLLGNMTTISASNIGKTSKERTLESIKKHLHKIGKGELYNLAKKEIEEKTDSIMYRGGGGSSVAPTEGSLSSVYMGNGGFIKYSILGGRMKIMEVYYSKSEFENFLNGGKPTNNLIDYFAGFGISVLGFAVEKGTKFIPALGLMWYICENSNSELKDMLIEAGGMYFQFITYDREGGSTSSVIPWDSYPFATVKDNAEVYKIQPK